MKTRGPSGPGVMVANTTAGARSFGYGAVKAWVDALDDFLPDGDPVSLLVGSEGALDIVTRARMRLAPAPSDRAVVLLALPSLDALTAVSVADAISGFIAAIDGMGLASHVAREPTQRHRIWALRHAASPAASHAVAARAAEGLLSMQFIEDGVVPQSALPE